MSPTYSASIEPSSTDGPVTRPHPLRVLFVEDHSDSRCVIANLLRRCGYDVLVAESAGAALQVLNEHKFDVILSDIGLPDGSGDGLIMLAKQRDRSIAAVALSGISSEREIQFSREMGFDVYLTKPVDFQELRTVLNKFINRRVDSLALSLAQKVA